MKMSNKHFVLILINSFLISNVVAQKTSVQSRTQYTGEVVFHTTPFGDRHLSLIGLFQNDTEIKFNRYHRFGLSLIATHDGEPSLNRTRDLQTFSNLEAGTVYGIFEAYYHYKGEKAEFKIGTQDLNSDLLVSSNALLFTHSSLGLDAATNINLPAITYPLSGFGITGKFNLTSYLNLRFGILDGRRNSSSSFLGLSFAINRTDGMLYLIEPELTMFKERLKAKFGTYYHSGIFVDNIALEINRGLWGFYSISDLELLRPSKEGKSAHFFYQLTTSSKNVSIVDFYFGAGFRLVNMIKTNTKNEIGIAVASASINPVFESTNHPWIVNEETVFEANWKIHFSDKLYLQPYFQYLLRKDGGRETNDPIIIALRGCIGL